MAFRYVPVIDKSSTTHLKTKIKRLRRIQIDFLCSTIHATSWEISTLDHKSDDLKKTMREFLMEIRSNEYNGFIFLGINEEATGGHAFTFPVAYEEKARDFIAEFPVYLKYYNGDNIKKYLTASAAERLDDAKWDSEEDLELDIIEKEAIRRKWIKQATNDQLHDETIEINNEEETNQDVSKTAPLFAFGNNINRDDASVSTFGTHRQETKENSNNDQDNESQKSDSTLSTMNSKTTIASRMNVVEPNLENMGKTLNQILLSLGTPQGPPKPPPVNGETQVREPSANVVSPMGDTAGASETLWKTYRHQ